MLIFLMFLLWIFYLVFFNVHFIVILLFLEVLLFSVFIGCSVNFFCLFGLSGVFIFLLVMVCMGGFGISLLVSISRSFGRDFWFHRFII